MFDPESESRARLLDAVYTGRIRRRALIKALGLGALAAPAFLRAEEAAANQQRNRRTLPDAFDYIVIGSGPAGCVLARRLTDAGATVLLVEAGGSDQQDSVTDPSIWYTNIGGANDWGHIAPPAPELLGRQLLVASGKLLGGGASINGSVWSRGSQHNFDMWREAGCTGWGWSDVLPVYRAIEDWEGGADEWRGAGGPIEITLPRDPHPTAVAWLAAAEALGFPRRDDINAGELGGAGLCNLSVRRDGTRASPVRAYLQPVLHKPGLTLLLDTTATRLLWEGDRCSGAEIVVEGKAVAIAARREVCVTAGAIGSAHLLQLSGIGDTRKLKALGIPVVSDRPQVGQNLQDHPLLEGVVFEYKGEMPPPRGNAAEATLFHASRSGLRYPDLQPVLMELPVITPALRARYGNVPANGFTLAPGLVAPRSRGSVDIVSADWREKPRVETGFLREPSDIDALVESVKVMREMGNHAAFNEVRAREVIPARDLDRKEMELFIRESTTSYFHPAGTCRMGGDAESVVDPELRVRGTRNLRVCDSSVMPLITAGNTAAPTLVIGEKAAALLLAAASA